VGTESDVEPPGTGGHARGRRAVGSGPDEGPPGAEGCATPDGDAARAEVIAGGRTGAGDRGWSRAALVETPGDASSSPRTAPEIGETSARKPGGHAATA
jgi:hypothetical protein